MYKLKNVYLLSVEQLVKWIWCVPKIDGRVQIAFSLSSVVSWSITTVTYATV